MKQLTGLLIVAGLAVFSTTLSPAQDEKPKLPPFAVVVLTDSTSGMSRLGDKQVELRLNPRGRGDLMTAPHVLVDENKVKINAFGRQTIAVEGRLTTKDVVVGRTNSIPGRNITAKALYLIAAQATVVSDDNKAKFPATGMARVQGALVTLKIDAGKGVEAFHAVENGDQPILLVGKDGGPLEMERFPAKITATGRLRVGAKGVLILDTETIGESQAGE